MPEGSEPKREFPEPSKRAPFEPKTVSPEAGEPNQRGASVLPPRRKPKAPVCKCVPPELFPDRPDPIQGPIQPFGRHPSAAPILPQDAQKKPVIGPVRTDPRTHPGSNRLGSKPPGSNRRGSKPVDSELAGPRCRLCGLQTNLSASCASSRRPRGPARFESAGTGGRCPPSPRAPGSPSRRSRPPSPLAEGRAESRAGAA